MWRGDSKGSNVQQNGERVNSGAVREPFLSLWWLWHIHRSWTFYACLSPLEDSLEEGLMKDLRYIYSWVIRERQIPNGGQNIFRLTSVNFCMLKIEDFLMSEWYLTVDIVVFLIVLFLVPELEVALWVNPGISISMKFSALRKHGISSVQEIWEGNSSWCWLKSQALRDMRISAVNTIFSSHSGTWNFMNCIVLARMTPSYIRIHRK